jgi:hypothetical protein
VLAKVKAFASNYMGFFLEVATFGFSFFLKSDFVDLEVGRKMATFDLPPFPHQHPRRI